MKGIQVIKNKGELKAKLLKYIDVISKSPGTAGSILKKLLWVKVISTKLGTDHTSVKGIKNLTKKDHSFFKKII